MEASVLAFIPSALERAKQKNKRSGQNDMVSTDKTAFSMHKNTSLLSLSHTNAIATRGIRLGGMGAARQRFGAAG